MNTYLPKPSNTMRALNVVVPRYQSQQNLDCFNYPTTNSGFSNKLLHMLLKIYHFQLYLNTIHLKVLLQEQILVYTNSLLLQETYDAVHIILSKVRLLELYIFKEVDTRFLGVRSSSPAYILILAKMIMI